MAETLYEKIWRQHLVSQREGETPLLYVDRHLIHEVTSPQAFAGLRLQNRRVRRPDLTIATMDHNISTREPGYRAAGAASEKQLRALEANCREFGIELFGMGHPNQGIVHVIGPELGLTLPGTLIVCGDSHTATHGAFGALAFGIGTSEVEHVLATQTLPQALARTMRIVVEGETGNAISAKDIILHIIGRLGHAGATGHVVEYTGSVIRALSMEARMTTCNMSIEFGAKAGLIAPDETTFEYLRDRPYSPRGKDRERALRDWRQLFSDPGASFDRVIEIDAADIRNQVTWGTNPGQVVAASGVVPAPADFSDPQDQAACRAALEYMDLKAGQRIVDIPLQRVFIGSCTNSRIEDLRAAAAVIGEARVADGVQAMVVPGSWRVSQQASAEGLDRVFTRAGFEWRMPGCSMCLAMNDDVLAPGERCAATSNRNFEGRQGRGGRTHLVSPAMAAAAAVAGHFVDLEAREHG